VRLLEPRSGTSGDYAQGVPAPFARRDGEWLVVPQYRIFGSDELSALAPAVAERVAGPALMLNPDDAASLAVTEGDVVEVRLDGWRRRLPVAFSPALPRGVAALPVGLPGLAGLALPAWARIVATAEARA
jgi:NADH-quinone oxidoreductase subunit G